VTWEFKSGPEAPGHGVEGSPEYPAFTDELRLLGAVPITRVVPEGE
jgi:hypothetical protein